MNLVRESGKLRVYESHGYTISIWDKGSIVVKGNGEDFRIDHNATNMRRLKNFLTGLDADPNAKTIRQCNKEGEEALSDVLHFSTHLQDDKIILDTKGTDQKVYQNAKGVRFFGSDRKGDHPFKKGMRYIISENDGRFVSLEEFEPITIKNIFQKYSEPLLMAY